MTRFVNAGFYERLSPVYGYHDATLVSLEKSLERLCPTNPMLSQYIHVAKDSCRYPGNYGLTKDESAAVYLYSMECGKDSLYLALNSALRTENREQIRIWFPYLKLFDTALNKLPTVKGNAWRGAPLDIGRNFVPDQIVTWWSIISCSAETSVIEDFLGHGPHSTLFLIESINGKNIADYTAHTQEKEIVLRMGSKFRVKGLPLEKPDGHYTVHLIHTENGVNCTNDSHPRPRGVGYTNDFHQISSGVSHTGRRNSVIPEIRNDARWAREGVTVAGNRYGGSGHNSNRLHYPRGLYIDEDQTLYIADYDNHRIVRWRKDSKSGEVIAGGNGRGNDTHQLNRPSHVIVDKETNSMIICDSYNQRVMQWSLESGTTHGTVILENIFCFGLTMDDQRRIYVTDINEHVVKRFEIGQTNPTIVAGGRGIATSLVQFECPYYIFVDGQYSVYVADYWNNRVLKWMEGATQGIVVAGGNREGNGLNQLNHPRGIFVDSSDTIFVADERNNRVMRWRKGATNGDVIVGDDGRGHQPNQLNAPECLAFDQHGNLYVVDHGYHRVQRFNVRTN